MQASCFCIDSQVELHGMSWTAHFAVENTLWNHRYLLSTRFTLMSTRTCRMLRFGGKFMCMSAEQSAAGVAHAYSDNKCKCSLQISFCDNCTKKSWVWPSPYNVYQAPFWFSPRAELTSAFTTRCCPWGMSGASMRGAIPGDRRNHAATSVFPSKSSHSGLTHTCRFWQQALMDWQLHGAYEMIAQTSISQANHSRQLLQIASKSCSSKPPPK